jgi:hypothetical protein
MKRTWLRPAVPATITRAETTFYRSRTPNLWLRLYKEICTDAWYQAHVVEGKDPKTWHPRERLKKVNQLFKEQGGKLIAESVGRDTHAT